MPDFPHPPFLPTAKYIPRQLNRWLDINAQGGSLGRIQRFITLPAFSVNNTWLGYSDIVAAFNFEGPNNFSLRSLKELPINPNYMLCIMWIDSEQNVHRYSLWSNVGEVMFFDITSYTGQLIKKNFRLEVWSTNNATIEQSTPITFYTSVLGDLDYRYGVDTNLVLPDIIVTEFHNINNLPVLPNPAITVNSPANWDSSGVIVGNPILVSWLANASAFSFVPTGVVGVLPTIGTDFVGVAVCPFNNSKITCDIGGLGVNIHSVILNIRLNAGAATGVLFTDGADNHINYDAVAHTFSSDFSTIGGIQEGIWYTIILSDALLAVFEMEHSTLKGIDITGSSSAPAGVVEVGNVSCQLLTVVLGILPLTQNQLNHVANYYTKLYFNIVGFISIPITFPSNAVPAINS